MSIIIDADIEFCGIFSRPSTKFRVLHRTDFGKCSTLSLVEGRGEIAQNHILITP